MRTFFAAVLTASVLGSFAGPAFAADLDYSYGPPVYERRPVPPVFIPRRVPPVLYRAPVVYPRPVVRVYPGPYPYYGPRPFYGPRPLVRVEPEPHPYPRAYAERGDDRPDLRDPRPYGGPGYDRRDRREAEGDFRERETYGRYPDRADERDSERDRAHYGHYLNHDELERRAEHERGLDDHYADRGRPPRDFDR